MSTKFPTASTTIDGALLNSAQTLGGTKTWNDIQTWLAAAGTVTAGSYTAAGAWSFGPATVTAAVGHGFAGYIKMEGNTASPAPIYIGRSATNYPSLAFNAAPTTTTLQYSRQVTDIISLLTFGNTVAGVNTAFEFHAFASAAAGTVTLTTASLVGSISTTGAWTFGSATPSSTMNKSTGPINLVGSSTATWAGLSSVTAASSDITYLPFFLTSCYPTGTSTARMQFAANNAGASLWGIGSDSTGNMVFGIGSGSTGLFSSVTGSMTQAGLWTLGTAAVDGTHVIQGNSTGANGILQVKNNNAATNTSDAVPCIRLIKGSTGTTAANHFIEFYLNTSTASGAIAPNGASAAAFTSFSDIRLKENIEDLPNQLDNILALRPVEFDYISGAGHQVGFIAQEMQTVFPDAVAEGADGMLILVGWAKTEARLVKALQELNAKFEAYVAAHP